MRRWVRRARGKGLREPELVVELHARRGMPLREVAEVLRLELWEVREHWRQHCIARAALVPKRERVLPPLGPKSAADRKVLREHVMVALWETVVATFAVPETRLKAEVGKEGADGAAPGPLVVRPSVLAVRLKALRQMGRMCGLGRKKGGGRSAEFVSPACATPEEIAAAVREWMKERVKSGQ